MLAPGAVAPQADSRGPRRSIGNEPGGCQLRSVAEVYDRALGHLLGECCPSCGEPAADGLCGGCRAAFSPVPDPCPGCGLGRPVAHCPRVTQDWCVAALVAPLRYEQPLDEYIHALKFLRQRRMGRALGLTLRDHLWGHETIERIDALVPVPLHGTRLRQRGFNQALEIARPIASATRVPLLSTAITRQVDTRPQTSLAASDRSTNMKAVFSARRRLDGMTVAIIDDVVTTGATVNALGRALLRAGASEVHVWAIARALPPER